MFYFLCLCGIFFFWLCMTWDSNFNRGSARFEPAIPRCKWCKYHMDFPLGICENCGGNNGRF